jgi:arylsulfatase A-like enzyme
MMTTRPHLLFFNPDEWRSDVLGHMGNRAAITPNLDQFVAQDAVSFRHAACQNPVCTPSRCSFLTGWYPHVRGHRTQHYKLQPDEPLLLKTLKAAGYFVWNAGGGIPVSADYPLDAYCDVRYRPPQRAAAAPASNTDWRGAPGSDTFYSFYQGKIPTAPDSPHADDGDWATVQGVLEFLQHLPADQPVCMYLALHFPHPPYRVEDPWYSAIDRSALPPRRPARAAGSGEPSMLRGIRERQGLQEWSEERWTELRATYYGMCARLDYQFGLVLDALRQAGIYDDTAIFFLSDHGDYTGDYGIVEKNQNTFEDCVTGVPFLIKPPASIPCVPRVSEALVELVDLGTTVEAIAGIAPHYSQFGRSLLPVLAGDTDEHRDAIFSEGGRLHDERHCSEEEAPGATDPNNIYWPRVALQTSEGPEHTKAVMCRTKDFKYVRRLDESDELYDLRSDPDELHNRIADPALAGELARLKDRLLTFYVGTSDVVPIKGKGFAEG